MRVSFVGSGNMATSLALTFYKEGVEIVDIASKELYNAEILAHHTEARACKIDEIQDEIDLLFICVPDNLIQTVSESLKHLGCPHVHTSGSVDMHVLQPEFKGVFYPLQTVKRSMETNFAEVPFLLETNDIKLEIELDKLASKLTNTIRFINSENRRMYHLAAVFSNNFTNHILANAEKICAQHNLKFEFLHPLIAKTFASALSLGAEKSQTGPAVRNDTNTIKEHLQLLEDNKSAQELYKAITESIIKQYK